jgi:hypothetical protein
VCVCMLFLFRHLLCIVRIVLRCDAFCFFCLQTTENIKKTTSKTISGVFLFIQLLKNVFSVVVVFKKTTTTKRH